MTYEERPQTFIEIPGVRQSRPREYSEETAREIDCAVRDILDAAYERSIDILTQYHSELRHTAKQLLEQETLTAEELPTLKPFIQTDAKTGE